MRRLRLAGALFAAAAAAVSLAFAAPASADPGDDFPADWNWIKNMASGLCLEPLDGSFAQGEVIVQVDCDLGRTLQRWQAINVVNGTVFQLRNVATGFCLDVNGHAANRTPVQQWTCNTSSNQKWDAGFNGNILRSRLGSATHCLDDPAASLEQRVAMQIYRCTDNNLAQNWDIFGPVINF